MPTGVRMRTGWVGRTAAGVLGVVLVACGGGATPSSPAHGASDIKISAPVGELAPSASACPSRPGFVSRCGSELQLDGEPFYFGGANDMWLLHSGPADIDARLEAAAGMGLRVLRLWANGERGSADGSVRSLSAVSSTGWASFYFQSWSPAAQVPLLNDGPTGMDVLDHAIARAGALGLKLIVNLVDNWRWDGGSDQYAVWYGLPYHDLFYTDARTRAAYQAWIDTVLSRVNKLTGVRYRDDPTIAMWELINEPHCYGDVTNGNAGLPSSSACTNGMIERWVADMSAYVKSRDPNHLVALGDVGYFTPGPRGDGTYPYVGGNITVDPVAVAQIPTLDAVTVHSYPDDWLSAAPPAIGFEQWGNRWIEDHADPAVTNGKPVLYEEIGVKDPASVTTLYPAWLRTIHRVGGAGFAFYQLTAPGLPVLDAWQIPYPSPTATLLAGEVRRMNWGGGLFPNALLSRGATVRTVPDPGAAALTDGRYGPGAPAWSAGQPTAAQPAVAALAMSGPGRVLLAWSAADARASPVDYRVDVSTDSTDGLGGTWRIAATVRGNRLAAREHLIDLDGPSWIRLVITAGSPGTDVVLDELAVHDAGRGARDTWMFLGGGVVAGAFTRTAAQQPDFAEVVHARRAAYFPALFDGSVDGETTAGALQRIDALLAAYPDVRYWALSYGPGESDPTSFRANLEALVAKIRGAGRVPLLARVPATGAPAQALAAAVDAVTTAYHLVPGPDLTAWLAAHPELLAADGGHLTDAGAVALNGLWADAAEAIYPQ